MPKTTKGVRESPRVPQDILEELCLLLAERIVPKPIFGITESPVVIAEDIYAIATKDLKLELQDAQARIALLHDEITEMGEMLNA